MILVFLKVIVVMRLIPSNSHVAFFSNGALATKRNNSHDAIELIMTLGGKMHDSLNPA